MCSKTLCTLLCWNTERRNLSIKCSQIDDELQPNIKVNDTFNIKKRSLGRRQYNGSFIWCGRQPSRIMIRLILIKCLGRRQQNENSIWCTQIVDELQPAIKCNDTFNIIKVIVGRRKQNGCSVHQCFKILCTLLCWNTERRNHSIKGSQTDYELQPNIMVNYTFNIKRRSLGRRH